MDCCLPGSSVYGILQAKNTGMDCHFLLQGSRATARTQVSSTDRWILYCWATRKTLQSMLSSVQFSCSVLSDSLWPHGLQHARLPCPSPTPRACSNSCPSSWWCHPTISSSVVPFSSCLQSFPANIYWINANALHAVSIKVIKILLLLCLLFMSEETET